MPQDSVSIITQMPFLDPDLRGRLGRFGRGAFIGQAVTNQKIELVLTAHPTEAQRRSALKKHEQMLHQMKAR